MKIVCIGGGPAGLYFGLLMKKLHPGHSIRIVERNKPYDTFGWGVVFSDATMESMKVWDPESAAEIQDAFNHWDDIEVWFKGTKQRTSGHGFVGIGRKKLLNILQRRCEALGVELIFETDATSDLDYPDADLVIGSDGLNSKIRNHYPEIFQPDMITRPNRYIWLGTNKLFDAFTFDFRKTDHGWFQAHIYKFDENTSTFIIETTEEAYRAHDLDTMEQQASIDFCQDLFAEALDGAPLMTNARHMRGSAWLNFNRLICGKWSHFNGNSHVVLMGDAAHTAHFAIGSGTKLAIDDAIELARQFEIHEHSADKIPAVLHAYEEIRRVDVARIQNAARNAMEWFEVVGTRYADALEPEQFMYSMLTRSQRISHENLRLRDRHWLEGYERWFAEKSGLTVGNGRCLPPMFTPFTLRNITLPNRLVVSPMAMYSAKDGLINDFHLVHLGARALGGAGLIFAEMTCVSPDARITPGCLGLWNEEQAAGWRRVVDFIHGNGDAKVGIQIGHAGRKGSTKLAWDGIDQPLTDGNWPLISASAIPYLKNSQVPKAMDRADMDRVKADHVRSVQLAVTTGADWLELHCAHGYLLSSFLSPLTNQRTDEYGGSHENRARYPLEIFAAIRAVWPDDKPISVRLSCNDWADGGNTPEDAAIFAQMFKDAGADLIDCSSGQVSKEEKPVYGRLFQTPFSDKIRNEIGIPTIAVGAISEADHANSIISAGRADLCAIARPHLADAAWSLHEAAKIGITSIPWPKQYQSAKSQYENNLARAVPAAPAK
ncbi:MULTISPECIES: bifunctional salicylyl-CoA 5-hydroxylase/oxidoreductase [unclassified Rhizobium]|uniref:bifunctional salicylyl-CoA 5-hydroxylase/oxidoreductase n=1 Tax=unclassified Rhizobium TaxID=2613769 RepID=UPI001ADCE0D7|nr:MULTISPECIES: bifunctional salicylyl-CoA 5-hydroxylase/oxidoreductase [unclassified Rhizobium]MBO9099318.1 bifunctional salicylyl-CoA 5-hydroxylase/oxidoreductase [Rhizobium sp. L58/93]MBO9131876.1 bifunctional salicylyl-CoA 5-hydroxylase/oxidoreductase [Rhizobium sp. B209b/85]MBO9185531.1 bifunctional salicylyl-CoA 5-hydroxylase/oxidoreductase [Rhizobium sp. E27B/91]QXZ85659.1 bifunctional salicylyl-CoA 5-hydroxylase/oxidoreductase [Rhizobium sp. K1/93]QXZ90201.1 bifunctional salicylyl-CoA